MRRATSILVGVLLLAAVVWAVPPIPPSLDDLVKRSDLIAIVTVTNVTDHVSTRVAWKKGLRQSAVATVKQTIKGTPLSTVRLTYQGSPFQINCRPCSLATGEFLVFLRRDGKEFVRTDLWFSQVAVATNQVSLCVEQPMSLPQAVEKIQRIVKANEHKAEAKELPRESESELPVSFIGRRDAAKD